MAAESSQRREGKEGKSTTDVDDMLRTLKLHDAELNDVVIGKDDVGNLSSVKWMAVAKVLTRKKFGKGTLMETMYSAWGADREVSFRELEPNLFLLQAFCLGDWKRIMEDGQWLFWKCALMTEPYDGASMAPTKIPNHVDVWIQIHKIPHLYRSQEIIKQLASRVGEVLAVDPSAVPTIRGDFFRVRVRLAADSP